MKPMFVFVPIFVVLKLLCLMGAFAVRLYAHGAVLLGVLLLGCGVASVVRGQWMSLAILAGMGLCAFLLLAVCVTVVYKMEKLLDAVRSSFKI